MILVESLFCHGRVIPIPIHVSVIIIYPPVFLLFTPMAMEI